MNKYFKYSFVVTCCSFLTCAAANGMKPFVPANPAQYSESTPRQDRHPFDPSSVSTTESATEELTPLGNTNLSDYQVNITISKHGFHKYKFSINNITTNDKFVVNSEFGRFEVEGQGPYTRGFDFLNEIYLYHCTACDTTDATHPTIPSVLPHVYRCPFKSCGLGVNCHNQVPGHRGYCTHGGNHYPQHGQLIYKFDCKLAQEICKAYENGTLRQGNPPCPLTLFQHQ